MLTSRRALREIYANAVETQTIKATLDEMLARGLPKEVYDRYLNEAIDTGLIPIAGRSIINGHIVTKEDILTKADILKEVREKFDSNRYFYGIS